VPQDRIEEAARLANAFEFINRLENGFDTVVGERGIRLSGGQSDRTGVADQPAAAAAGRSHVGSGRRVGASGAGGDREGDARQDRVCDRTQAQYGEECGLCAGGGEGRDCGEG